MNVLGILKNIAIIVVGSVVAAGLSMKAGELIGELISDDSAPVESEEYVTLVEVPVDQQGAE